MGWKSFSQPWMFELKVKLGATHQVLDRP